MTATDTTVRRRPPTPGPGPAPGSGCSESASRRTGPSSMGCASGSRATSGAWRNASARSAARSSRPAWSTPRRPPAPPATASPPSTSTWCSATRSPTRPRARCCRPCRRPRCPSSCSACSPPRRSTTSTSTPANGWPTAPPAASPSSPAPSRARGSPTTPSPAPSRTTSARGRRSPPGSAPPAWRASLRRARIGFLGHTYPGMLDMYSDFTAVHAQLGAHVEVLEIDDLGARVAQATDAERAAKEDEIRAMFDFADPSGDPIAARSSRRPARLVGARGRRPRPAGGRLRARRSDLLLPRRWTATRPSASAPA